MAWEWTSGRSCRRPARSISSFSCPARWRMCGSRGRVVWQDWNGRAGIQFVDVPQTSRRVLQEWLNLNVTEAPKQEKSAEAPEPSVRPGHDSAATEQQTERQEAQGRDGEAGARLRDKPDNRRGQTRYACRLGAEVYQRGSSVRGYCHLSDLSPGRMLPRDAVGLSAASRWRSRCAPRI